MTVSIAWRVLKHHSFLFNLSVRRNNTGLDAVRFTLITIRHILKVDLIDTLGDIDYKLIMVADRPLVINSTFFLTYLSFDMFLAVFKLVSILVLGLEIFLG